MHRHLTKWKHVYIAKGTPADGPDMLPTVIYYETKATLLSQIVAMPKGIPISFEDAVRFMEIRWCDTFDTKNFGYEPGGGGWLTRNFVEFIAMHGFHIELTGDEFEVRHGSKADN